MTPDSITIDGVTITRHIWELTSLMLASSNDSPFPYTWEEFVAANTKPKPKYKVGDYVVVLSGSAHKQIGRVESVGEWHTGFSYGYTLNKTRGDMGSYYHEPDLRPATREDFMMEFCGVKVWMEKRGAYTVLVYHNGTDYLDAFKAAIYHAAGVMDMPEQFWKEK